MTAPCWFNTYHIIHCWKINLNLFWFVTDSKIKWQQQSFKLGLKFSKKALGHYKQLTLVWVYKMQIFNLIQFVLLDLWPIKDGPCRPLPGGQKLHFYLAAFCKKYNILGTFCQIKLKICSLLNFRVLNQNLMVNRDEYIIFSKAWKMISFYLYSLLIGSYAILIFPSDLGFLKTVRNGQLPTEFGECGIADKVS